jgi:hypothetical protein
MVEANLSKVHVEKIGALL